MMTLKISTDKSDINSVIEVVKSFGPREDELLKIQDYIAKELEQLGENRILFILEDEETTYGVVQLLLKHADDDPLLANGIDIAHIHALQVNKKYQRKGHALQIMKELEAHALSRGITKLTLGVDSDNPPALNLYENIGYTMLREEEGRCVGVRLYYMYKDLT